MKMPSAGYTRAMRIRATDDVAAAVQERGGRLYVWTDAYRCCSGPLVLLQTGAEPPKGAARRFRAFDAGGFELLLDSGGRRLPEELVLELRGRRRRRRRGPPRRQTAAARRMCGGCSAASAAEAASQAAFCSGSYRCWSSSPGAAP